MNVEIWAYSRPVCNEYKKIRFFFHNPAIAAGLGADAADC